MSEHTFSALPHSLLMDIERFVQQFADCEETDVLPQAGFKFAVREAKEIAVQLDRYRVKSKDASQVNPMPTRAAMTLEEAYNLLNAVYYGRSFDWNLIAQFLDRYNNDRIDAQYRYKNVSDGDSTQSKAISEYDKDGHRWGFQFKEEE